MIEFRRHAHSAQLAYIMAATMGGAKDAKMADYVLGYARVSRMGEGSGWRADCLESPAAQRDLALAVQLGLVSQYVFSALTA